MMKIQNSCNNQRIMFNLQHGSDSKIFSVIKSEEDQSLLNKHPLSMFIKSQIEVFSFYTILFVKIYNFIKFILNYSFISLYGIFEILIQNFDK